MFTNGRRRRGRKDIPVEDPTLELVALIMTDAELARAQVNLKAAMVDDVQQIKRLPPGARVDTLASALRLKIAFLETLYIEGRIRRSFVGSKG